MAVNSRKARTMNTLHYPCAYVIATCADASINIKQYIDKVYTLEHTLHILGDEFLRMWDVSTWEVLSSTFELVLNRNLRRKPRGCSHVTWIRNDMDIMKNVDTKHCSVCRPAGHNRSKCPY
ncbi:hypothetical protein GOBAR_DD18886 [Gossypium barbadense]|nr:hypothetical protein GOBAR_DD18886 [Gossypium barbadense]